MSILRLKVEGLAFAGLPCSSFIFLNRATSRRSATQPLGATFKKYIKEANTHSGCKYIHKNVVQDLAVYEIKDISSINIYIYMMSFVNSIRIPLFTN